MSKAPSPPAIPNPYQTSQAQTQQNIQTALANARLGAVNQVGPYGTVSYSFGSPTAAEAAAHAAGAGGLGGAGGAAAAPPPGLAWANHVRGMLNLPALTPGTPQYDQWLRSQGQGPYGAGGWAPPGAAQGGGGMGGLGGGHSGGAFAGGGGAGDPGAGSHGGQPTR
ncbi:MAG TPA: hypothetical protein VH184_13865 [Dongiaceae bacterium]|jgi:hypothetical protein|nr:hypothetical protein [Dongiaceae bacterium]